MNRRRKVLGLRKQTLENDTCNREQTPKKSATISSSPTVSRSSEEPHLNKAPKQSSPSTFKCVSSEQKTPKRHVQVFQSQRSPNGLESLPKMMGSPEIEVSWDWGCSQIPKDMLPSKRVRRASPKPPTVVLSPLIQESRVIQSKQMSEEENQERLAFYKNVLSQASKCKTEDLPKSESSNDSDTKQLYPNPSTPKSSKKSSSEERDSLSKLFDDSANDFMLECSQVIEDKLKNGQIDFGSVVSIRIRNPKHCLSPDLGHENEPKKVCHMKSKSSLFREEPTNVNIQEETNIGNQLLSSSYPQNDQMAHRNSNSALKTQSSNTTKIEPERLSSYIKPNTYSCANPMTNKVGSNSEEFAQIRHSEIRSKQSVGNTESNPSKRTLNTNKQVSINNNNIKYNTVEAKKVENRNSIKYDSVDKFRRISKGGSNVKENVINSSSKNMINGPLTETHLVNSKLETTNVRLVAKVQDTNQNSNDFSSLLDDGFDMELSSLDVDSICQNSQVVEAPKVCTKAEIEAKRKAALTRLRMKMKR